MAARPFARYEWLIAWRYARSSRAEGGVSVMTWISVIGIMLAVAALIITLAVRAGFRADFVDTILGANAHVTVTNAAIATDGGGIDRTIADYAPRAQALSAIPGVVRAAPLVTSQVMAASGQYNTGVQVIGIRAEDLADIRRIAQPEEAWGDIARFGEGVAIGSG
ncbi:MAG: ABC transporter permease, partial [Shimia sp.]